MLVFLLRRVVVPVTARRIQMAEGVVVLEAY
jgi:hypothetical protein